jgi:CRISPR/Cas system CSM-associated protein Csm3 (group 7 of RAMP superfamily)
MTMSYEIQITLQSDATFGRGDGVAGLVDEEVEHDPFTGLPYLRGRALKGLLVEECANLLFALPKNDKHAELAKTAQELFGSGGSGEADAGMLRVGNAAFPQKLVETVQYALAQKALTTNDVLESLTTIRRQTTIEVDGAPEEGSLRSMRALLRGTTLTAPLTFAGEVEDKHLQLLSACVLAMRRGGIGRNRGRGRIQARLRQSGADVTKDFWKEFRESLESKP